MKSSAKHKRKDQKFTGVIYKTQNERMKSSLRFFDGRVPPQACGTLQESSATQRKSCLTRRHCKRRRGVPSRLLRNRVRLRRRWPRPSFLIQFSDFAGCLDEQTMLCLLALRHVTRASPSERTLTRMPRRLDMTTSQQKTSFLGTYTRPICASETKLVTCTDNRSQDRL